MYVYNKEERRQHARLENEQTFAYNEIKILAELLQMNEHILRKVKQIVQNVKITKGRNPTKEELMQWTGRSEKELREIMRILQSHRTDDL
jgi:hypothetical protein